MKPRREGLLPVIGIGPMLTQVVLIQQFVLHRRELWRKLAREQTHIGALFQYHGVMHRIGGIFPVRTGRENAPVPPGFVPGSTHALRRF